MSKEQLLALETKVNAELTATTGIGTSASAALPEPITDGVVDFDLYLTSSPKMLWILKEPVDEVENGIPGGGGWSMTKHVLAVGKFGNRPPFAPIAYVTYSVFHNFPRRAEIKNVTDDPSVRESVKRIAYINVNKMPAMPTSYPASIATWYGRNQHLLLQQVAGISPDIIIGGATLPLFFDDLGLNIDEFIAEGSAAWCVKNGRLYINACHPSQRNTVANDVYVDDIVAIIKNHSPVLPPPQSSIGNQKL